MIKENNVKSHVTSFKILTQTLAGVSVENHTEHARMYNLKF